MELWAQPVLLSAVRSAHIRCLVIGESGRYVRGIPRLWWDEPPQPILIEPTQLLCDPQTASCRSGTRPTNNVSIEIEIRWNVTMLLFIVYSLDHREILHTSRQSYCREESNNSLWSVGYSLHKSTTNFERISNSIEIPLVGLAHEAVFLLSILLLIRTTCWASAQPGPSGTLYYLGQHSQNFVVSPCELLQRWVTAGKAMLQSGSFVTCSTVHCVFQLPPKQILGCWKKVINWPQQEPNSRCLHISTTWRSSQPRSPRMWMHLVVTDTWLVSPFSLSPCTSATPSPPVDDPLHFLLTTTAA